jgi:hypothetical protein
MLLQNWDAVPIQKLASGIERQMIVGEKMMICRLRFVPHTPTTAHDHPHEQMTFVCTSHQVRGTVRPSLMKK